MSLLSKEDSARRLAQKHYEVDSGLTNIFWFKSPCESDDNAREPIKLLEVNATTVSSGVLPLHFAAAPSMGINYPTVIVEVTPDEYRLIEKKELALPKNWDIRQELLKAEVPTTGTNVNGNK